MPNSWIDARVRVAVVLDELAELLLVALLLAERLDGADAGHRLDELARSAAPRRVRVARNSCCERTWNQRVSRNSGTSEPASTRPLHGSSSTSATAMNTMYSTPRTSPLTPSSSSSRIDVEVARLARDDAARRVGLVELEAQPLGVQEHPLAQVEQHRLADAGRQHRVPRDEHGADDAGEQVRGDRRATSGIQSPLDQRGQAAGRCRYAMSAGPGDLQRGADHDDDDGERPAARAADAAASRAGAASARGSRGSRRACSRRALRPRLR